MKLFKAIYIIIFALSIAGCINATAVKSGDTLQDVNLRRLPASSTVPVNVYVNIMGEYDFTIKDSSIRNIVTDVVRREAGWPAPSNGNAPINVEFELSSDSRVNWITLIPSALTLSTIIPLSEDIYVVATAKVRTNNGNEKRLTYWSNITTWRSRTLPTAFLMPGSTTTKYGGNYLEWDRTNEGQQAIRIAIRNLVASINNEFLSGSNVQSESF